MQKICLNKRSWETIIIVALLLIVILWMIVSRFASPRNEFEITDSLGGNIFPSAILSVASTDAQVIAPIDSMYVGNPKSLIAIRVKSPSAFSRIRIELLETSYFSHSVSEFILDEARKEYTIYPDIIWNYDALRNNSQPAPVTVVVQVEMNGNDLGQQIRTFSMRSLNECLLGYVTEDKKFHNTSIFFAAYVNEDNPMIDMLLREALNTGLVNRFLGYQNTGLNNVESQVYALWRVLQKRNFRYSSVSNSSLSSNIVYAQRVRTFYDALEFAQVNCVDGSVLFASLLRAINIDPVLIQIPGHMFIGYYGDKEHKKLNFLEMTMVGDGNESPVIFDKAKDYARNLYEKHKEDIHSGQVNYMFLEISEEVRREIQPLGR